MDYQEYTAVDFVLDDDFFRWVMQPDSVSEKFWSEWLERYPHKRAEVDNARKWILDFRPCVEKPSGLDKGEKEDLWKQIMVKIDQRKPSED